MLLQIHTCKELIVRPPPILLAGAATSLVSRVRDPKNGDRDASTVYAKAHRVLSGSCIALSLIMAQRF